jgi:guanylate kinase
MHMNERYVSLEGKTNPIVTLEAPQEPSLYLADYKASLPQLSLGMDPVTQPWMLINWPFLDKEDDIRNILSDAQVAPVDDFSIDNYPEAGRYLYPVSTLNDSDFDTWGWYAVSRMMAEGVGNSGKVLLFDQSFLDAEKYLRIVEAKKELRRHLGEITFSVLWQNEQFVTDFRSCHAPDFENIERELRLVKRYEVTNEHLFVTGAVTKVIANEVLDIQSSKSELDSIVSTDERSRFEPISYLMQPSQEVMSDGLYLNKTPEVDPRLPLVITILGASGSGKDSILAPFITNQVVNEAIAATSRQRRNGETTGKYVWMRDKLAAETEEEYHGALIEEYDLLESAHHNGNYYGLPRKSLNNALSKSGVVVVVTDNEGAQRIKEESTDIANCVSVFVTPATFAELWPHVRNLDNPEERIREAVSLTKGAPKVANYYLHNSRTYGIERSINALGALIRNLRGVTDEL